MNAIEVLSGTQHIVVSPGTQHVSVTNSGPPGPAGPQGPTGAPGSGAVDTVARDMISLHLIDTTPHSVYDDMPDLTLIFENGLI